MSSYNYWDYNPETKKVYDLEAEHGLVLADIYPYDDADDIGRLIAAAPEMYELLIFAMASLRDGDIPAQRVADRIEELLARIDGEEAKHE